MYKGIVVSYSTNTYYLLNTSIIYRNLLHNLVNTQCVRAAMLGRLVSDWLLIVGHEAAKTLLQSLCNFRTK